MSHWDETYEPNDSPFGDAYCDWISGGDATLDVYSGVELAEFSSCAAAILGVPVYRNDERLNDFLRAIDMVIA